MFFKRYSILVWTLLWMVCSSPAQEDGLFADFSTTMGGFTCRLDYVNAPLTVANFVGLAEGSRPWLDFTTGRVCARPYYDGLIFHRVATNFMNQSGSRNGQGSDGPGYVFADEFSPLLRHDSPGVLSMANSGKNSNGSQFFITVTNTPWLDDVHSIFGRVVSGLDVVQAINRVQTTNERPLVEIRILQVAIRRVGESAEAFVCSNALLPPVSSVTMGTQILSNGPALNYPRSHLAGYQLYASSNLLSWTRESLGYEVAPPTATGLVLGARTTGKDRQFYTLSCVQYSSNAFCLPRLLTNRTMQLVFSSGLVGSLQMNFTNESAGLYSANGGATNQITSYAWQLEPYRGYLWPIYFTTLPPMTLTLAPAAATNGTFSGTCYYSGLPWFSVSGSFALGHP